MVVTKRWRVLLHVERDRDALWLVQALESSECIQLVWLAKDCEEALLYLRAQDVYENRAKYPQPSLLIVNSARQDARGILEATNELLDPPLMVQLTARPDVSESLRAVGAGVDCCQPKPTSLEETIAFVDWLEDWLATLEAPDNILALPRCFNADRLLPDRLLQGSTSASG
jgi:DNA-binding response OmpR family regulator